jgi:hypothetical protein
MEKIDIFQNLKERSGKVVRMVVLASTLFTSQEAEAQNGEQGRLAKRYKRLAQIEKSYDQKDHNSTTTNYSVLGAFYVDGRNAIDKNQLTASTKFADNTTLALSIENAILEDSLFSKSGDQILDREYGSNLEKEDNFISEYGYKTKDTSHQEEREAVDYYAVIDTKFIEDTLEIHVEMYNMNESELQDKTISILTEKIPHFKIPENLTQEERKRYIESDPQRKALIESTIAKIKDHITSFNK